MNEIWKPYPSNPKYQVSNLGQVRDLEGNEPPIYRHKSGHYVVSTHGNNRKRLLVLLHRMVLETFVGPCPDGMVCCHGDGNPASNSLTNLRWDTRLANKQDGKKHGEIARGERAGTAKLTDSQVREIRRKYKDEGVKGPELARQYGVWHASIYNILHFRSWKHIK